MISGGMMTVIRSSFIQTILSAEICRHILRVVKKGENAEPEQEVRYLFKMLSMAKFYSVSLYLMQESIELPDFLGIAFAEIGDYLNGPNCSA
jgi:hypothetical protein